MAAPYLAERAAEILQRHRQRFRDRTVPAHEEVAVTLADGGRLVLELSNSFLEMPGQPVLLLSIFRDLTARVAAEAQARAEETRLRMALEAAGMVTWEWDIPTATIRYSDNLPTLIRGPKAAPFAQLDTLLRRLHPEDREKLSATLDRTVAEACTFDCEYRVRMLDGLWHWVHGRGCNVIVENGRPARVQGVSQDITGRKEAEADLQESEVRFRTLFDHSPIAILELDFSRVEARFAALGRAGMLDFRAYLETHLEEVATLAAQVLVVAANQKSAEVLGAANPEALRANWPRYFTPGSLPAFLDLLIALAEGGTELQIQLPILNAQGQTQVLDWQLAVQFGHETSLARVLVSCVDITARQANEAEIRRLNETLEQRVLERTRQWQTANAAQQQSEARYQRLHESMMDAFASVSLDGAIQDSNRAFQELLGYSAEELRRLTYPELTPEKWHAMEAGIVAGQIRPHGFSEVYEKEYRRRDGTVFPVELRTFLLRDEAGQPSGMWAIVRDITLRQQAQAAIQQLNATLEQRVRERTQELVAANAKLRESETSLQQTAEAGRVGLWRWDPRTNDVNFSPEWKRQLGYSDDEFPNDYAEWERRLHPADRAATLRELHACFGEQGRAYRVEFRLQHRDGSYRFILAQGTVFRSADGTPTRMLGSQVDLTERRAGEEQIRKLSRAVEQSPASVVITDLQGNIEYVNARFSAVTGYRFDEVRGQNPRVLKSGEMPPAGYLQLWQTITSGGEWRGEFHNRKKNGDLFWELASISPIVDGAGRITHFLAVKEDITEQKQAATQLAESEQRFRTLFESAPVAIAVHGANGRYLQVNPAYAEMLGYSVEELLRLGVRQATHPDDVAEGQHFHQELQAGRCDRYQREKRFVRRDGRIVWAHSSAAVVRDAVGQLRYIISIVDDITAQRRAAQCRDAFSKLGLALSSTATPGDAAQIIMDTASALFAWDAGFLNQLSSADGRLNWLVRVDTLAGQKTNLPAVAFGSAPTPLSLEVLQHGARLVNLPIPSFVAPGLPPLSPFGDMDRPSASMLYAPIRHGGKSVGVLSLQSYTPNAYTPEDLETLQSLADHCGGAVERIHAQTTLRALEVEVLEAGAREQTRIGCELHDGVVQSLGGLALRAKLLAQTLREAGLPVAAEAETFTHLLSQTMRELRRLARGLAPVGLELQGLPAALERLALDTQEQGGVPCTFAGNVARKAIPPGVALHLFRIAQEAVANARRHARSRHIEIALTAADAHLTLTVRDDGQGFDPTAPTATGMGRHTMRYRANAIGASLDLVSQPGQGTEIRCTLADARWRGLKFPKEKNHENVPRPKRAPTRPRPRRG